VKNLNTLQKSFSFLKKLDLNLLITTKLYEDKYNLTLLKNNLYKYIISFKKEKKSYFKIKHINDNKFNLLFYHYLDKKYLYINIDFISNNKMIFYIYNDIYIVSTITGEILNNITEKFLLYLNEEELV